MGYLVIFSLKTLKSAHYFDTHNDAVDFINKCSNDGDSIIRELHSISDDDKYIAKLTSGDDLYIQIVSREKSTIKYDLTYQKNANKPITRRFSSKQNAINYAHKLLDDYDAMADPGEDDRCEWVLNDTSRGINMHLVVTLVVLSNDNTGTDDYKTLKISPSASKDEVKAAFKELAKKNHPDAGGDAETFAKIREAYERIMDGNAKKVSRKVREEYNCFKIQYLFEQLHGAMNDAKAMLRIKVRNEAKSLMSSGAIMFVIGLLMSAVLPVVFVGLLLVGVWRFFKGLYYYVNPDSLINKAMKNIQ